MAKLGGRSSLKRRNPLSALTRSTTLRGGPVWVRTPLIETLASSTTLSAVTGEQGLQRRWRQAMGRCLLAHGVRRGRRPFPSSSAQPFERLHRQHRPHRRAVPGDAHGSLPGGPKQLAEPVPSLFGSDFSHVGAIAAIALIRHVESSSRVQRRRGQRTGRRMASFTPVTVLATLRRRGCMEPAPSQPQGTADRAVPV